MVERIKEEVSITLYSQVFLGNTIFHSLIKPSEVGVRV